MNSIRDRVAVAALLLVPNWRRHHGPELTGSVIVKAPRGDAVEVWQETSGAIRQLSKMFDRLESAKAAADDLVRRSFGHTCTLESCGEWLIMDVEQLTIPAKPLASATDSLPGAIDAPPAPASNSQGVGTGGGAGTGAGTGITLMAFNDTMFTVGRGTSERAKAVDRLASWGGTALYDVILRGTDMLGGQTGRKAIIVFSDGEDEGSHAVMADVERRLQASDVTLYMIGQGRGVTMEPLKEVMQRLVAPTGGRALFTENIDELHVAFNDLLDELSNQYLLGYPPANAVRDDAWRRITVDVDGRYVVRARQGYRASPTK